MNRKTIILLMALIVFYACSGSRTAEKSTIAIIPAPAEMTVGEGTFTVDDATVVGVNPMNSSTKIAADLISGLLRKSTGFSVPVSEEAKAGKNIIFLAIDTTLSTGSEGYSLEVTRRNVVITARTATGLYYGAQTLRQLLPPEVEKEGGLTGETAPVIPACLINDEPRFGYRGIMLDVSRHMFPVDSIKNFIDLLAMNKINRFHWHLTDDQGWRIEIKKYPNLTASGSVRKETLVGHGGKKPFSFDGTPYGGFYTQDEVREVVRYASERFITVIPEIEMPGHATAAVSAYPVLSCTGKQIDVATRWGVFEDVYCAGKDTTFSFLEDVLDEVMELFPSEYIHVGGDECPKTRWEKCPACQKRIREEGLKNEHELQSYFIQRMEKYLSAHGRKLIGWDEILEGGLAPGATVMSWRGIKGGIDAAKMSHDVIMSPTTHMYLDYYQCEPEGEPLGIGGYLPLEKVYSYEPLPEELTAGEQKYILGLQGNIWTEYIPTVSHLQYMAFPRAFAVAETGWTPLLKKDFEDFLARFEVQKKRYDLLKVNYFRGEYRDTRKNGK